MFNVILLHVVGLTVVMQWRHQEFSSGGKREIQQIFGGIGSHCIISICSIC